MLQSLSPLDNRYQKQTQVLTNYFSEFSFCKYRIKIEILWFEFILQQLYKKKIKKITSWDKFKKIAENFNQDDFIVLKNLERETKHDLKAIEYFIKKKINSTEFNEYQELVHFGLTSDDVNNTAYCLMFKQSWFEVLEPSFRKIIIKLADLADSWRNNTILAHTHGQPASPTTMGKEFYNFSYRLARIFKKIEKLSFIAKINGTTGNHQSQNIAFPNYNWQKLTKQFIENLGLEYNPATTQIEPHDFLIEFFQIFSHLNSILIGFCQDIWHYISLEYFSLAKEDNQVGSSVMPHKINPIDFENAEGNLSLANSLLEFFTRKLPISRLQRDLSDSTVLRNIGSALGYQIIALNSILTGLEKLNLNIIKIEKALNSHWEILAEPLQTVLRKNFIHQSYEKIKTVSQGINWNEKTYCKYVKCFEIPNEDKLRLLALTPNSYIGTATNFDLNFIYKLFKK